MTTHKKRNFCPKCGTVIKGSDNFCSKCGNKISNKRTGARRSLDWKWISIAVVVVAALIAFVVSGISSNKQKSVNLSHNNAQIRSIVAAFDCSCGQCDRTLANCDCPTANDTKKYISRLIDNGKYSRKEVIQIVKKRYGHLRSGSNLQGG